MVEVLTGAGGEGMVVKPPAFIASYKNRLLLAVKCHGRKYLRIIYGTQYTMTELLEDLRNRSVVLKRSLALREFAMGIEGLERFVNQQPLRKIHEGTFGVLALESKSIDPRL